MPSIISKYQKSKAEWALLVFVCLFCFKCFMMMSLGLKTFPVVYLWKKTWFNGCFSHLVLAPVLYVVWGVEINIQLAACQESETSPKSIISARFKITQKFIKSCSPRQIPLFWLKNHTSNSPNGLNFISRDQFLKKNLVWNSTTRGLEFPKA